MSIPYIRACQRGCTYCKKQGHLKPNCPHACRKCEEILAAISLIQHCGRREEERLVDLFTSEKLTDLCFLMNTRNIREWVRVLLQTGKITEPESKMTFKRDRVRVLMLIYWFNSEVYLQKMAIETTRITIKTPETVTDLSVFECPICVTELPAKEKIQTGCKHCICKGCLMGCLEHQIDNMDYNLPRCVMCRTDITEITITNTDYVDEVTELTILM